MFVILLETCTLFRVIVLFCEQNTILSLSYHDHKLNTNRGPGTKGDRATGFGVGLVLSLLDVPGF